MRTTILVLSTGLLALLMTNAGFGAITDVEILNPSFENDSVPTPPGWFNTAIDGWNDVWPADTDSGVLIRPDAPDGGQVGWQNPTGWFAQALQDSAAAPVVAGSYDTVAFSFDSRHVGASGSYPLKVSVVAADKTRYATMSRPVDITPEWQTVNVLFQIPTAANGKNLALLFENPGTSANQKWIDNVSFVAPLEPVVVDDGDPGFSTTGAWTAETGTNMHNGDELWQSSPTGTDTATWSFDNLDPDARYLAYASWKPLGNRTAAASYSLSDGYGTINPAVNQQPWTSLDVWREVNGVDDGNGEGYARLSNTAFAASDGTLDLTVSDTDSDYLMADAARLEPVRSDVKAVYVIDDEIRTHDDGTVTFSPGNWGTWSGDPGDHYVSSHYGTDADATATYTFTDLPVGLYRVSANWVTGGNRPTDATYTLMGFDPVTVNQQVMYADDFFEEVLWQDLFDDVWVTSGSLAITLNNAAGGAGGTALIADAMRLEKLHVPEPSSVVLLILGLLGVVGLLRRL